MNITLPRETVQQAIDALDWMPTDDASREQWFKQEQVLAALRTALEAPAAPVSTQWLAEMIMSDCGCSTNNQRLLDRIINRIDKYERANAAPAAPRVEPRKPLCELCVKRGYNFCANAAETTLLPQAAPAAREEI